MTVAAREIFELLINADGSAAAKTFGDLGGKIKKDFGDLETKSGGFIDNLVSKSPAAAKALDRVGVSGSQAGSLIEKAIPMAVAAGGAAIGAFAVKSVGDFQHMAQEVLHFQQIAGGTAEEASRWVQTADDFGVSTEQLAGAMGKFEVSIGKSPQKLADLGVEIAHTKDGGVDLQQTFFNVIDAYNSTDDATKKATIAQQAFGKQWQGLVKLLDAGSENVRKDFESINKGQLLDQGNLKDSEAFRVAIDNLHDRLQALEFDIGKAVLPVLTDLANALTKASDAANFALGPIGGLQGAFSLWAKTISPAVTAVDLATKAYDRLTGSVQTVTPHINSFLVSTEQVTGTTDEVAQWQKAMDQTFKVIDKGAQDATKAFAEHDQALFDVSRQYGDFGMIAISNANLSTDALNNMAKEAAGFRDSMFSSFHSAMGPLDEFANKETVTADQFMQSLREQEQAAENWAANLQAAADAGINEGFIEKIAEAGPKAAPILTALLDAVHRGDTDAINRLLQDTDNALTQGANAVLNHKPEWSNAGTGVGAATKDGAKAELDKLGAVAGSVTGSAADIAKNNALPEWIAAGTSLGSALVAAAQRSVANYHPATTPNLGGGKDARAQATGGVMSPGALTLVGEKGPELVVPGIYPKSVIPNNVLRGGLGGGNTTVNIYGNQYGVEDVQGAIYDALENVTRRAKAGVR